MRLEVRVKDNDNYRLGAILSAIGAIFGLVAFWLFVIIYHPMIQTELDAGRPDEAFVVKYVFPALGYIAITSGVLWALAMYGFILKERWAWMLGVMAGTFTLLASFFPMIPAGSRDEVPVTAVVFTANLLLWVGLVFKVRSVDRRIGMLAFAGGLGWVLSFMDGVAVIDKMQVEEDETLNAMYVMLQEINWWAAIAWAVFIFALLGHQVWAHQVGLGAAMMASIGGFPLAIVSTVEEGRFSLFSPAPLLGATMLVILLRPNVRSLMLGWANKTVVPETPEGAMGLPRPTGASR